LEYGFQVGADERLKKPRRVDETDGDFRRRPGQMYGGRTGSMGGF